MNWKDLKDFCNKLPEEELQKKVIMWREEETTEVYATRLDEDHYRPEGDDYCYPESNLEGLELSAEEREACKKVWDKGEAILQGIY